MILKSVSFLHYKRLIKAEHRPFSLKDYNAKQAYATGRGIQPDGIRVGDNVEFQVNTKDAGDGDLSILIKNSNNDIHSCQILPEKHGLYRCFYTPDIIGTYMIDIKLRDEHILLSPFEIRVKAFSNQKVVAFGPGLISGITNQECFFLVETNEEVGSLEFAIRGPSESKINCVDNGDGSVSVYYVPFIPGEYAVHVLINEDNIPKSPFMVNVVTETKQYNPSNVKIVYDKEEAVVNELRNITLTFQSSVSNLEFIVECYDSDGMVVPVRSTQIDEEGRKYSCSITFTKPGKHRVMVSYHGINIPPSPFEIFVQELSRPDKVKIFGPCLDCATKNQETYLIIDCSDAGPGDIELSILDEHGCDVEFKNQILEDSKIKVVFTPLSSGPTYTAHAYYHGKQIPDSPFKFPIKSDIDLSKIVVEDMRKHVYKLSFERFVVNATKLSVDEKIKIHVKILDPNNKVLRILTSKMKEGIYHCKYSPLIEGTHEIKIYCNDISISSKPFLVQVISGFDASRVTFSGDGLFDGVLEPFKEFLLNLEGAGEGGLSVAIDGPTKTAISCLDNEDGTCIVKYYPTLEGQYIISVKFHNQNIKGSPFNVKIRDTIPGTHIKCTGLGLEPQTRVGMWSSFTIDGKDEISNLPVDVSIIGAESKERIKTNVTEHDRIYNVNYISQIPEKLQINIKMWETHVKGSPFYVEILPAYDIDKVKVYGEGIRPILGYLKTSLENVKFFIDIAEAGDPPIDVQVKDNNRELIAVNVQLEQKHYQCSYKLNTPGDLEISVLCKGVHIIDSPFLLSVIDDIETQDLPIMVVDALPSEENSHTVCNVLEDEFLANIDNTKVQTDDLNHFYVNDNESVNNEKTNESARMLIHDMDVHHATVITNTEDLPKGSLENGVSMNKSLHIVKVDDEHITNFISETNDIERNTLENENKINENTDVKVSEDSMSKHHEPQDKILEDFDNTIKLFDKQDSIFDNKDSVEINDTNETSYITEVKTQENSVKSQQIYSNEFFQKSTFSQSLNIDSINKEYFDLNPIQMMHLKYVIPKSYTNIKAEIKCQDNSTLEPDIEINHDYPYVHVYFQPKNANDHILHIVCDGEPLNKSPYLICLNKECMYSQISAVGPGLRSSVINTWSQFTIDSKNTCHNDFSIAIYGPKICKMVSQDNEDGTHTISYLTTIDGVYRICIKYIDVEIIGSPFTVNVLKPNIEFSFLKLETMTEIPIKPMNNNSSKCYIIVLTPSGEKVIWNCTTTPNGYLGILARPNTEGEYLLLPYVGNKRMSSKAFSLIIDNHHLPHPENIIVIFEVKETYTVGEIISISVDTSRGGYGHLNVVIEGPDKAEIKTENVQRGKSTIIFTMKTCGLYLISMLFATETIHGFPKIIKIVDEDIILYNSNVNSTVNEVPSLQVDECLKLKWPYGGYGSTIKVQAKVKAPSGNVSYCDVIDFDNQHFNILFTPREVGEHKVSVKDGKLHLPGSPFKFFVENVEEKGSKNVQVFGMGLQSGHSNEDNEFSVYLRDAGPGSLSVSIDGPSKANVELSDCKDGSYSVKYNIPKRGHYMCSIKFNDEHIPGSPFKITIEDAIHTESSKNITLASVQNHGNGVGNRSEFIINQRGLNKGTMRAFVKTPSFGEEVVSINHIENDHFNVQFEPKQAGLHYIHVLLNEKPISGSPFEIMVGEVDAYGQGLIDGKVGEENYFRLNTKFAEAGPLTVTIDGPSKVELDCYESDEGFEFSYVPTQQGEYVIAVKYGPNIHAKGSPFKVKVTGERQDVIEVSKAQRFGNLSQEVQSYPENVKCRGDGLAKAFLGRNNQFIVDASSGGAGVLYVGIVGPSKPCEECTVRHIGGKRFEINYFLQEYGEHVISIRWGEREIPGSPYYVTVQ